MAKKQSNAGAKAKVASGTDDFDVVPIKTDSLDFDIQNPRLAEFGLGAKASDKDILTILWNNMDVLELIQSIAASGFFQHEALIVVKTGNRYVVIEGNRRLAAVRLLRDRGLAIENNWEVPTLGAAKLRELDTLPCIITTRAQSWRYLGFKHVNGPAKWSSFAKAQYIAHVHETYNVSLEGIATQIGDRNRTVARLYRGLAVLDQAKRAGVYDSEDRFRNMLAFSHLYTGLGYEGVQSFLGITKDTPPSPTMIPRKKLPELGEYLTWLYGNKPSQTQPVIQSQNPDLRRLDAVLRNRESLAALRAGQPLVAAFEISRPPSKVFEEALMEAKRSMQKARSYLTDGFDKSDAQYRIAQSILEMAEDMHSEMNRKRTSKRS